MRTRILIFLFVALLSASAKGQNQLLINGKVLNYNKKYAVFAYDTIGYHLSYVIDTIRINENGQFNMNVKPFHSNAILIFEDRKPIGITIPCFVNKPIKIILDCTVPENIEILGKQAVFVRYYLDQMKYWTEIYQSLSVKYPDLASGNKTKLYANIQDSITQLRIQYLTNYFKTLNVEDKSEFIFNERNSLMYANLYYRMSGENPEIIKRLAFYQKYKGSNSNDFLTFSNEVNFSNEVLISLPDFQNFVFDFILNSVRLQKPDSISGSQTFYLVKGLSAIDEWFKIPKINALQKTLYLNYLIENAIIFKASIDVSKFQKTIESLDQIEFVKKYLPSIENKMQQLNNSMSKFSRGTKVPDFTLKNGDGKSYTLSQFKGKLICIDVWASWCKPCIASFPEWKNLVSENLGNINVVFLSISLDEDYDKWTKALEKFNPSGIILHAGLEGFNSSFAKAFEINAIPTCILIDPEGNFISVHSSFADAQVEINKYTYKNKK